MTSEFKKIKNNEDTHYVLETATAGATSAGVVATAPGKKREDSILAQEKKETPKPRNFVAKNAKMGGAGQHKDKKKAAKQGDVKHKKPLAESYAEDLAKQVFDANPNIKDENAVLDAAWPIVVQDLGKKTAMSMFNYDEDFPSDLVSVYDWLQKNQQGVAEGLGNFAKAIDNLHGWYQDDSSDPNIERYEFDDREGGYYAYGTIEHNLKTGEIAVDFEDKSGEYDGDIKATFNSIGDAMNVLRRITTQHRYNTGKAQSFDRLGDRTLAGPDDVYKTDRAGKKGTLTKSRMDTMKMSSPYRKTGPKGVLPEQGVAEGFNGEYDDEAGMAHSNLLTSARAVQGLLDTIEDRDNLPEWAQEKIAKAEMMLVGVWDYLQSQKEQGIDPQVEGFGKMRGSSSAYDRDYASSVSGMGRGPDHRGLGQELAHETNNYAVAIDGKTWKVFADQRQAQNIAKSLQAKGKKATVHPTGENPSESVAEVAPPGWEKTVKAMKKHDEIDNPYALAWSMKNKGYKSHKKESTDPYFESLRSRVEELAKK